MARRRSNRITTQDFLDAARNRANAQRQATRARFRTLTARQRRAARAANKRASGG